MIDALTKNSLSEFRRAEFLDFVRQIFNAEAEEEEEGNRQMRAFSSLVPHPLKSDLISWPEEGADDTPEGVVAEVERYCRENGLACFKDSEG